MMKLLFDFGVVLLVIVAFTQADPVPFQQHRPATKPGQPLAKITVAEYVEQMRQETQNPALMKNVPVTQDKSSLQLPLRPMQQNGTGIRKEDWMRKMNALGGQPNGIPGQRSGIYESQNEMPRPRVVAGNQNGFFASLFPGKQNGKPRLENNWSEEENLRIEPIKPRPQTRPRQPKRPQGRNKAQSKPMAQHGRPNKDCGCNPVNYFECGVDGKTYQNACFRICAAITFKKTGHC